MAFSDNEKASIRKVMCAPKRLLVQYGLWWDRFPLEDAMDQVGEDPEASAIILSALDQVANLDTQIDDIVELAFVNTADAFKLEVRQGIRALEERGRQKIRVISDVLGLEPMGDYYSAPRTQSSRKFI